MSAQQRDHLSNVRQNQSLSDKLFSNASRLLDFEASRHMTGQYNYLFNVVSIPLCFIGFPNGVVSVVIMEGSVRLGPNSVLLVCCLFCILSVI